MATWTPPPRPPPTPPPPPLRRGCSASVAGDGNWGWGSGWAGTPASRGGSGGWKVGEVGCFLFTALALRGAGSGCLLTVLGKGGRGERVQEGKPYAFRQNERAGDRERQETDRERWRERQRETPLPEFKETSSETRTQRGHKTT